MSEELFVDGLGLAPGVMETIVAIAAKDVEGVASVGASSFTGLNLRSRIAGKSDVPAIDVSMNESDGIDVDVHIDVQYGKSIPKVAAEVRQAVADAVAVQVGFTISSVDVYVDGIRFED